MKKIIFAFSLVFAVFLHSAPQKVERFLLVAGANDGGNDRVKLRYAESDANSFAGVLSQMGGVDKNNVFRVYSPNSKTMQNSFFELEKQLKSKDPSVRKEVFVYYSGHADDKGLRLGGDIYSWAEFRKSVNNISADMKVAVIDACGSGAITRTKGGVSKPVFMQDASSEMKGYAFLTSSNENEASQESDRLKGSFFTHALVSGLRGAADMTGNGKVTLNEAYQYAFDETLKNTQNTSAGSQHPSRDMNLAGTGDVVMTDLRETGAILVLDSNLEGKFFIRDAQGNLFAELQKIRGRQIELGMPAGKYSVQMEAPSKMWMAKEIQITEGKKTSLLLKDMKNIQREVAVARGDADSSGMTGLDSARRAPFMFNPWGLSSEPANGVQGFLITYAGRAYAGTQVAVLGNIVADDMAGAQFAGFANLAFKDFYGLQAASSFNYATNFNGVQAAITNMALRGNGVQASTVNLLLDSLYGFQGGIINLGNKVTLGQGGAINVVGKTEYAQGGVVNVAGSTAVQGGVINVAGKTDYVQGGVVNVTGKGGAVQGGVINVAGSLKAKDSLGLTGIQGGVINIGGHVGRQIGLINVAAKSDKTPIGLISIVGNGVIDATVYVDETGRNGATFHLGTPYFYTIFEYTSSLGWDWPMSWGIGFGTRFGKWGSDWKSSIWNLDYTFLNTYGSNPHNFNLGSNSDSGNYLQKIRFGGTCKLIPGLGISSGLTLNALSEGYGDGELYLEPRGEYHWHWNLGKHKVRLWPGLYAGLTVGKF